MLPDFVVLYIVAGAFTAALAGLTQPTGLSSFPATFISMIYLFAVAIVSLAGTVGSYRGAAARALYLARTCRS